MCIPISFCFEIWYLGGQNTQQPIQLTGRPSDMWARVSVMTTVNIFVRLNIFSVEQQLDEDNDTTDPPHTTLATWHLDTGWAVDMDWWQDNRFRPVSVYLSVCLYTNIKFLSRHLFQVRLLSSHPEPTHFLSITILAIDHFRLFHSISMHLMSLVIHLLLQIHHEVTLS